LSREGYNLIFIVSKEGPEKRVTALSTRYGVQVEFITAENYLNPGHLLEDAFRDKDISIIVSGVSPIQQSGDS
jgi:hypothetical protein